MVANVAVTIGWRVLWFVAAVAIPRLSVTAATAPQSVDASLRLKRSDTNAEPSPSASASRASSRRSRGESVCPASV